MQRLTQVFDHANLRAVVDAFEFDFVHQGPNQLQTPPASTLRVWLLFFDPEALAILACQTCRYHAATGYGNDQLVGFHAKTLVDFSIGTEAMLGRIDAGFDERRFDLIDRFGPKVYAPSDLFDGMSRD